MKVHLATKFADKVRVSPPLVVLLALTEELEMGQGVWIQTLRNTVYHGWWSPG